MKNKLRRIELKNGRWWYSSPYFIFIKNIRESTLFALLEKEGITILEKLDTFHPIRHKYEFFISHWKDWATIMDNWWYSLSWYNQRNSIFDKIGKDYEVFECMVGDVDHSFSFKYQKKGKIIRHLEVSNLSYKKGDLKIEIDEGSPLPGEAKFLKLDGQYEKIINILYEQGIEFPKDIENGGGYIYSLGEDKGKRLGK